MVLWACSKFAQNKVVVVADSSDAEEQQPFPGTVDFSSSDIELNSEADDAGSEQICGFHWPDIKIENGSVINSAYVQFEADETRTGTPCDLRIWMEDADNAAVFVEAAGNISTRPKTSAFIEWTPAGWTVQDRLAVQRTPDISTAVKEVVDRGSWAAGNAMVNLIQHRPGSGNYERRTAEAGNAGTPSDANGAMLQVAWDNGTLDTGLSIFEYNGIGKVAEMLHGLDAVPEFFVVKRLDATADWRAYHSLIQSSLAAPEDGHITFNNDAAATTSSSSWNNTAPGAEFVTLGNSAAVNAHDGEYIGWAMREIEGYSKLFRYLGNGSSLGDKIYCGFKPRMVVIKRVDAIGDWVFHHRGNRGFAAGLSVDGLYNQMSGNGYLNTFATFANDDNIRAYANGFRIGDSTNEVNAVGGEYVGFAFAEVPYQSAKAAR